MLKDAVAPLIVYVILSRVRSLSRLRSIGLTSKIRNIIEGGPQSMVAEHFERLFRTKITNTIKATEASKTTLDWN